MSWICNLSKSCKAKKGPCDHEKAVVSGLALVFIAGIIYSIINRA